jgi:uncharacterized membrane protein YbjE (DUF340 family)
MYTVLLIMLVGMLLGYVLRSELTLVKVVNASITWIIYLLLFVLGVAVGVNDKIMNNLNTLGFSALIISVCAILGSVTLAWIAYKITRNKDLS